MNAQPLGNFKDMLVSNGTGYLKISHAVPVETAIVSTPAESGADRSQSRGGVCHYSSETVWAAKERQAGKELTAGETNAPSLCNKVGKTWRLIQNELRRIEGLTVSSSPYSEGADPSTGRCSPTRATTSPRFTRCPSLTRAISPGDRRQFQSRNRGPASPYFPSLSRTPL